MQGAIVEIKDELLRRQPIYEHLQELYHVLGLDTTEKRIDFLARLNLYGQGQDIMKEVSHIKGNNALSLLEGIVIDSCRSGEIDLRKYYPNYHH